MFPDRRLLAEDVIQSGDEDGGFLSSHRIISPMTHLGDGNFGPATGRKIHARTIADCVCKNNRIVHEWLVRDHAAIALQIGSTPKALAQTWLAQRGGWRKPIAGAAPPGYVSHISTNAQAQSFARAVQGFVHGATEVAATYDDAAHHIGPGEQTAYGHAEIAAFWHSVFGGFNITQYQLEHLAFQADATTTGKPDRLALRFRAVGDYLPSKEAHCPREYSIVRYNNNSANQIELLGIVHAEFRQGRVFRQWVLLDDVAIWMQILDVNPTASA
jgi:predicted ester cyclase